MIFEYNHPKTGLSAQNSNGRGIQKHDPRVRLEHICRISLQILGQHSKTGPWCLFLMVKSKVTAIAIQKPENHTVLNARANHVITIRNPDHSMIGHVSTIIIPDLSGIIMAETVYNCYDVKSVILALFLF